MRFEDKVVWITGASSGIGEALVRAFHAEGAHVVLSARRRDRLEDVRRSCREGRGTAFVLPLDVADQAAAAPAATRVLERFGRIDVLVNNAGVGLRALIADTDMAVLRRVMEIDFFGAAALTKAVLPSMLERKTGHVVAIGSVAGEYATPYRSGYCAAKAAMHAFFESLRAEVHRNGIAVTLIVPGAVRTDITVNALRGDGAPYGRMSRYLEAGMSPDRCAARILDAVARRKEEVMVASGEARRLVLLKRFLPGLVSRMVRL